MSNTLPLHFLAMDFLKYVQFNKIKKKMFEINSSFLNKFYIPCRSEDVRKLSFHKIIVDEIGFIHTEEIDEYVWCPIVVSIPWMMFIHQLFSHTFAVLAGRKYKVKCYVKG